MNSFYPGNLPGRAVIQLLVINGLVFLADFVLRNFFSSDFILYYFSVIPGLVAKGFIWQIFSYQFLHGGFFHLLFNMAVLWMFGSELEQRWGYRNFLKFYLSTGTMTGFMIFLFNYVMGYDLPTIGASGVMFAIMLVYAIYWGDRTIYIWMVLPVRVKYFVIIMGVISFVSMLTPGDSGISHVGHFGGLVSGYIYYRFFIHDAQFNYLTFKMPSFKTWKKKKEWEKKDRERYDNMSMEQQVDEILSKISRLGMKSLSSTEKRILKDASEKLNGKNHH